MILSKTTEYALNVLAFMATRNKEMYPADYLCKELKIPRQYLKRLLTDLSKKGFITSIRGRNGGFIFSRDLSTINFLHVIEAMEGPEAMNTCLLGFTACIVDHPCVMHDLWTKARSKMTETLTNTSFADLKNKYDKDKKSIAQIIIH
ncbi:MAG: Rrf2 family transcriptional regulator [Bacteroidetes bacterium]|nr:Rrf2 family transcriptional regulator [Bacteroidota bacterium]